MHIENCIIVPLAENHCITVGTYQNKFDTVSFIDFYSLSFWNKLKFCKSLLLGY